MVTLNILSAVKKVPRNPEPGIRFSKVTLTKGPKKLLLFTIQSKDLTSFADNNDKTTS